MRAILTAFAGALALIPIAVAQTQPAPPPNCSAPEFRAFDFWIGEWDAYVTGTENLAGRSTIAREDDGCVITEHWTSPGYSGRSLNIYDRTTGHWNQFWVDSTGEATRFVGNPLNGGMQLTDPANINSAVGSTPMHTRMTFTANADGTVRQFGESSPDGEHWTARYDFTYRPHRN
jgi:hypothetical protein